MTRYCPDCGTGHECGAEEAAAAASAEVEITRLNTKRDIEVARINASASKDIAETEAESAVSHAEGVATGIETVLDAVTGGGEPEPGADPVVVVDPGPEPEPDEEPGPEPPPLAADITPEPEHRGRGWWDNYR